MKTCLRRLALALACIGALFSVRPVVAADTIPIAFIAPFSGPFAPQGDAWLKMLQYALAPVNASGGALGKKFELVTFDDKIQPAEALIALGAATDRGIPFILQCIGSNVAAAMVDGVSKYNARNPDRRVLYLNCAALATELTNEKCDFWHFRFAGNVSQRVETMVRALPKTLSTVYLMNQDYLYGQSVQHDLRIFLAKFRPDIKIVGDELVPFGKVKDFSPYISKVKASGAQALLTSNWGTDFNQLLKAGVEAGLAVDYYTYSAHLNGGPTAMGQGGIDRVHAVVDSHMNIGNEVGNAAADAYMQGFRDINPDFDFVWINFRTMFEMLQTAVNKAGSTDALAVALALEGIQTKDAFGQPTSMRKEDHQLLVPFYQAEFVRGVKFDSEKIGAGWKTEMTIPAAELAQPTTCKMKRPAA
jgi:branched-chain amino acid transport system substrate-binding protein